MSTDRLFRPFLVAILVIASFFVGHLTASKDEAKTSSEALDVISDSYFRDIDRDELENASVRGMVDQLRKQYKDRFSHYFGPEAYARFKQVTEGRFSGVGLTVSEVKQGLRVSTVLDDSPAKEAGIREADIVTAVEGRSIAGEDATLATAEIKGKPGTEVTITVLRPSEGKSRDYTLTRRELTAPAVEGEMRRAGDEEVGYVRLLGFSHGAHAQLRQEVERLRKDGAQGLVIDLRGNGGGLLTEAVLTSSVFVEDGVIVSTSGRAQEDETFEAVGDAVAPLPTIVLIDRDTASAAEIFTAALGDAGIARIAGETSFGKGVFQEVIPLENGGALDLTVGEYLARDGESLADKGVEPELPAKDVPETKPDEGLREALAQLGASLSGK